MGELHEFEQRVREHEEGYDLVVLIAQKYNHESDFRRSNQLLLWDAGTHEHYWLNDWYEGEECIKIIAYERIDDIYLW